MYLHTINCTTDISFIVPLLKRYGKKQEKTSTLSYRRTFLRAQTDIRPS